MTMQPVAHVGRPCGGPAMTPDLKVRRSEEQSGAALYSVSRKP
jgi:hypothetical protein